MNGEPSYDAVVIGSGPNGLAAAIRLGQAGKRVLVLEEKATLGGGLRTEELTLPGFRHDVCATSLPLGVGSPYLSTLPLADHGVRWVHPRYVFAHPFDDGAAVVVERDLEQTIARFPDAADGRRYRRIIGPLIEHAPALLDEILAPLHVPRHPFLLARFGMYAVWSGTHLAGMFRSRYARGLIAGLAAHATSSIAESPSAAIALVLATLSHRQGWAFVAGGAAGLAEAMKAILYEQGGEILLHSPVRKLDDLPQAPVYVFDVMPNHLADIAGWQLPEAYVRRLRRYEYGPAGFKIDWALSEPVPWKARACHAAGVVHVGGDMEAITAAKAQVAAGEHPEAPFLLVAQQSLFDPSLAPGGHHLLWGYCHVPNGSTFDMTERMERQIERFAPGFRDIILARHVMTPLDFERHNSNLVGGDIAGGATNWRQLFTRPMARICPYSTPNPQIYICSAATPPGGGLHGMCGYHAAEAVLRKTAAGL